MSRYKIPNKNNSLELCQRDPLAGFDPHSPAVQDVEKPEYDYAETRVLGNNVIQFSRTKQQDLKATEKKVPYYHVVEEIEQGVLSEEQKQEGCIPHQENAPYYRVLEGPSALDPKEYSLKGDSQANFMDPYATLEESNCMDPKHNGQKGPIDEAHATGALYHVLEGHSALDPHETSLKGDSQAEYMEPYSTCTLEESICMDAKRNGQKGPTSGAHETGAFYHVLEGPSALDPQDNSLKGDSQAEYMEPDVRLDKSICMDPKRNGQKGPISEAHATGAYYHVLTGPSSSDTQGTSGYKELPSNGESYTGYQPLQKYAYADSGEMRNS